MFLGTKMSGYTAFPVTSITATKSGMACGLTGAHWTTRKIATPSSLPPMALTGKTSPKKMTSKRPRTEHWSILLPGWPTGITGRGTVQLHRGQWTFGPFCVKYQPKSGVSVRDQSSARPFGSLIWRSSQFKRGRVLSVIAALHRLSCHLESSHHESPIAEHPNLRHYTHCILPLATITAYPLPHASCPSFLSVLTLLLLIFDPPLGQQRL